jgi:hypothetical protein
MMKWLQIAWFFKGFFIYASSNPFQMVEKILFLSAKLLFLVDATIKYIDFLWSQREELFILWLLPNWKFLLGEVWNEIFGGTAESLIQNSSWNGNSIKFSFKCFYKLLTTSNFVNILAKLPKSLSIQFGFHYKIWEQFLQWFMLSMIWFFLRSHHSQNECAEMDTIYMNESGSILISQFIQSLQIFKISKMLNWNYISFLVIFQELLCEIEILKQAVVFRGLTRNPIRFKTCIVKFFEWFSSSTKFAQ